MKSSASLEISDRFFTALAVLKADKVLRGKSTFCKAHGIDRRHFYTVEYGISRNFELAWLGYLVEDYNVSALWLLTGKGSVYAKN